MLSHLTRGAWIEIEFGLAVMENVISRTSHEVRGLKLKQPGKKSSAASSHLTRGAWIEMYIDKQERFNEGSRTSHEVRGLKLNNKLGNFL